MNDLTGHVTKGYELKERIGAGGFGAVYRAYQSSVGREVAIKVILPEYASEPDFIRRFETEAQLVARLEHPFIVPLFDYWREPAGAYLVMRFFRGGSLKEALKQGPVSLEDAARLLDQITGALAVAHRNNVIHRDLKPDNILLDDDGNAFLTDFGIAKRQGRKGEDDEEEGISGSPGYMSPEQIINNPISPQTDIYSLGIVIYEMLTGTHPFSHSSTTELIFKHLQEPLPDIKTEELDLPPMINEIIQRATSKIPDDRYPDAISLAKEFKQAISSASDMHLLVEEDFSGINNPYKGLRAFEEADSADFFGREALVRQLVDRMTETGESARFLAVVGPSGSGKSSVVKAGLLPALRWGDVSGSDEWFIAEMVPSTTPMENLASALLSVALKPPGEDLLGLLRRDENGLQNAIANILPDDAEFLLVIDQFEEIFTLLDSEQERVHFLSLIRNAVGDAASRVRVIVTLRADFYDRPLLYEGFGTLMRLRTEVVLPLSSGELERAITGPAERVGLAVDANLLAAIVSDVSEEPGALPLLQYVMTEVFERREGRVLTLYAYQQSGGALGALARRAEELYSELRPKYQMIARQLFLRLVTLGEGTEDTRRRVQWAELMSFGVDRDSLQVVLDAFGKYRLLSFDRDMQTREPTVEVAHEALIREWKRLREWLNESRQDVRLQRNLAAAAADWARSNRDGSFLLRGNRLSQLEEWAEQTDLVLTQDEKQFLQASIAQRQERDAEEAARLAHEAELERISRLRLRGLVAVLALAFIVALGLSLFAFTQSQEASAERDNAQTQVVIAAEQQAIAQREAAVAQSLALSASARQLEVTGNIQLALALALEANQIENPPDQVQRVLGNLAYRPGMIQSLVGHEAPLASVAFSPDGTRILSGATNGSLIIWDAFTREPLIRLTGHSLPIASVAFSPDGQTVLSGSWDTTLILWDVETGEALQTFRGHRGSVNTVAISPDGQTAVSGSTDGLIHWDMATGEIIQRFGDDLGNILSVAISPDNQFVLAGSDSALASWDLSTGEVVQRFTGHSADVLSVAISPDGVTALSSSRDNSIILWDFETGRVIRRYGENTDNDHSLPVNSAAYTPDNRFILTASDDAVMILWDLETGEIIQRFTGHTGAIASIAVDSDGQLVVSGAEDNTLIVWNVTNSAFMQDFVGHRGSVNSVQVSADGRYVVTGADDESVIVWDAATGEALHTLTGHADDVLDVAISQDSTMIASSSDDGSVLLWEVESGELLNTFTDRSEPVNSIAFSPDGSLLVAGLDDGAVLLWDVATGQVSAALEGHTRRVLSVAFSPNGDTLLSGSDDRTLILWDVATGAIIHTLTGHERRVLDIAYSPDGMRAFSGSDDDTVILWDLETGTAIRRSVAAVDGQASDVLSVAYHPTAAMAISGLADGWLLLWDLEIGQPIRTVSVSSSSDSVVGVAFDPNGETAITTLRDGAVMQVLTPSLQGLIEWVYDNRFVPQLTCEQQAQYGTEVCEEVN